MPGALAHSAAAAHGPWLRRRRHPRLRPPRYDDVVCGAQRAQRSDPGRVQVQASASRVPRLPALDRQSHPRRARRALHRRQLRQPQASQRQGLVGGTPALAHALHPNLQLLAQQVERFFSIITDKAIRRGSFASVKELVAKIDHFVAHYNENCKPFIWTATADSILAKLSRLCERISETGH